MAEDTQMQGGSEGDGKATPAPAADAASIPI